MVKRTAGSWRPFTTPENEHFESKWDAVIATLEIGHGRSYDVYTFGELIATRPSLAAAKMMVDSTYGPQLWKRVTLNPMTVVHKTFGPTDEFSEPQVLYVVENLPRL